MQRYAKELNWFSLQFFDFFYFDWKVFFLFCGTCRVAVAWGRIALVLRHHAGSVGDHPFATSKSPVRQFCCVWRISWHFMGARERKDSQVWSKPGWLFWLSRGGRSDQVSEISFFRSFMILTSEWLFRWWFPVSDCPVSWRLDSLGHAAGTMSMRIVWFSWILSGSWFQNPAAETWLVGLKVTTSVENYLLNPLSNKCSIPFTCGFNLLDLNSHRCQKLEKSTRNRRSTIHCRTGLSTLAGRTVLAFCRAVRCSLRCLFWTNFLEFFSTSRAAWCSMFVHIACMSCRWYISSMSTKEFSMLWGSISKPTVMWITTLLVCSRSCWFFL